MVYFKRKEKSGTHCDVSSKIRTHTPIPSEKGILWLIFRAPVSLSVPSKQTTHKLQQITIVSSFESIIHCFTQSKWLKIASCFTLQGCCQTSASHHDFTRPYWKGKVPCIEFGSPPLSWNYQIDARIEACRNKFPKQYFVYLLTLSNSFNSVSSAFFYDLSPKGLPKFLLSLKRIPDKLDSYHPCVISQIIY